MNSSTTVDASVQARANDNDNDRATDQLALLAQWSGQQSITLPCGRYHLSEIDGSGSMTINAQGNVAIFVDGALSAKQGLKEREFRRVQKSILFKLIVLC